MSKKAKKDSANLIASKNKKLDKEIELEPLEIEDDEDSDAVVVDDTVDPEVLKVLKPAKPKVAQKPIVDKHDYIAELERDDVEFDDL